MDFEVENNSPVQKKPRISDEGKHVATSANKENAVPQSGRPIGIDLQTLDQFPCSFLVPSPKETAPTQTTPKSAQPPLGAKSITTPVVPQSVPPTPSLLPTPTQSGLTTPLSSKATAPIQLGATPSLPLKSQATSSSRPSSTSSNNASVNTNASSSSLPQKVVPQGNDGYLENCKQEFMLKFQEGLATYQSQIMQNLNFCKNSMSHFLLVLTYSHFEISRT